LLLHDTARELHAAEIAVVRVGGFGDRVAKHGGIGRHLHLAHQVVSAERRLEVHAVHRERDHAAGYRRGVCDRGFDDAVRRGPKRKLTISECGQSGRRRTVGHVPRGSPAHNLNLLLRCNEWQPAAAFHLSVRVRTIELDPHRGRSVVDRRGVARHLERRPRPTRPERLAVRGIHAIARELDGSQAIASHRFCGGIESSPRVLGTNGQHGDGRQHRHRHDYFSHTHLPLRNHKFSVRPG
jgi:hypothetical protein